MSTASETYIKAIEADYRRGNATEYTYRKALETFMESLGHGIAASNDPKHIQCGVPEEVWDFKIGGYQVCEKWLKDRKGRTLSGEEISHYQRVVVAINETIRLMSEIDRVIPKWPME